MADEQEKPVTTPAKRAKATRKTASPRKAKTTAQAKTKAAPKRTRSTKAETTTKPAAAKPEPKARAQEASPQPSSEKKEGDWGQVLWQFAGVLFFTGLSALALAVLASLGLANLVLKLIQAEQSSLKNAQAWVHAWLNDALLYIAQPQGELPFPFRPATPPNPKS